MYSQWCCNLYFLLLLFLQITFLNFKKVVGENRGDFRRSWCILIFAYVEASKEELTVINDTINLKEMLGFSESKKTYHFFLESELKGNSNIISSHSLSSQIRRKQKPERRNHLPKSTATSW